LELNEVGFTTFPEEVLGLKSLYHLSLQNNDFADLLSQLSAMHKLKRLDLSGCYDVNPADVRRVERNCWVIQ